MSATHGKLTKILLAQYDVSSYFDKADIDGSRDEAEVTGFGATGKSFVVGHKEGKVSLGGMFDGAAGAIDEQFNAMFNTAPGTAKPCTIYLQGDAIGGRAIVANFVDTTYKITSSISDAVRISAEGRTDKGPDYGFSLAELSARATGGPTRLTAVDRGATNTTSVGFVANIHCTAKTGTPSLTVTCQDSADNLTFADLTGGAFTALTDVGSQEISHATTSVRRYIAASWTITGAASGATFSVALAPRA